MTNQPVQLRLRDAPLLLIVDGPSFSLAERRDGIYMGMRAASEGGERHASEGRGEERK